MPGGNIKKHQLLSSICLPLLSAILFVCAHPPLKLGFLAWIAIIPLIYICITTTPRVSFWSGFCFSLLTQLYLNAYLKGALEFYLLPMWSVSLIIVISIISALTIALFCLLTTVISTRVSPLLVLLSAPAIWVVCEYLRTLTMFGYTVGFLGYTQASYPFLLNIASVFGYWGLPFTMILLQTLIALLVARKLNAIRFLFATLICIFIIVCGLLLPSLFTPQFSHPLQAVYLQGNVSQTDILDSRQASSIFAQYKQMSQKAVAHYDPDIIIWPETVVSLNVQRRLPAFTLIRQFVADTGVPVMYGAMYRQGNELFNSVLLETGTEYHRYDKRRLVPAAEYLPSIRVLEPITNDLPVGIYDRGSDPVVFTVDESMIGTLICYESYFSDITRHTAQLAHHIFVLTNDAWFNDSIGLDMHASVGAIRAAEVGVGVTQVANTGITVSYDYLGREVLRAESGAELIIFHQIDMQTRQTIYRMYGDFLVWASLVLIVGLLLCVLAQPVYKSHTCSRQLPMT